MYIDMPFCAKKYFLNFIPLLPYVESILNNINMLKGKTNLTKLLEYCVASGDTGNMI
jgi:hypothetical protein